MIAEVVGFGTVWSPRANCRMTDFAGTPDSGFARRWTAYAAGLPACDVHSVHSSSCWIADAPGTASMSGGWFRSGMFSLNAKPGRFVSGGVRLIRLSVRRGLGRRG